jgi:glycosyltransferase involved in cell wall biosynthesis
MSQPRFRLLLTADAVGGVWQYSLDLARGLSRLGVDVVLAVLGPAPSRAQRLAATTVPRLKVIETGLALDWMAEDANAIHAAGDAVAQLALELDVDLIQLHSAALLAGGGFAVPAVAVHHSCVASWWEAVQGTALPEDFSWRTEIMRAGLKAADAVVTPSLAFSEVTARLYGLAETPRTVHNGRTPIVRKAQAEHDFVFTAGRLWDEGKNLHTLDAAAKNVAVPVHAAGPLSGPNGTQVIFQHLHCLGSLGEDELGQWLAAKPVFVSTAFYEPFGLAVLEAAQAGCPLVLSDIPTFRELWGDVAIFVDPRDEAGFTRAISDLVCDDFQRSHLGAKAKDRASRYTPDVMAAQMAALYRSLLPAVPRPLLAACAA